MDDVINESAALAQFVASRSEEAFALLVHRHVDFVLDEGLQAMREQDRLAVILHCLEDRSFREVGALLGVGEEAARKRVDRALGQLTRFFRDNGFAVPAIAASTPMFTLATVAAPSGVAAGAISVAASGAASLATTAVLTSGTTYGISKLMATTQLKLGIAGALVVSALTTTVFIQRAALKRLETDHTALKAQLVDLDRLGAENRQLRQSAADTNELQRLRNQQSELMRLRDEVGRLRVANKSPENFDTNRPSLTSSDEALTVPDPPAVSTFRATIRENVGNGQTILTGGWRSKPGQRLMVFITPQVGFGGDPQLVLVRSHLVEMSDEILAALEWESLATETTNSVAHELLEAGRIDSILAALKDTESVNILGGPTAVTTDGNEASISVTQAKEIDGSMHTLGPVINLTPRIASDGQSVDLEVDVLANVERPVPGSP